MLKQDILKITSGTIIHGVNCQGVMASGLAGQIKAKYPEVYQDYMVSFVNKKVYLGNIIPTVISEKLHIINACTQEFYGRNSNIIYVAYPAIKECFIKTAEYMIEKGFSELYYPKIGAGLGNGDWPTIQRIIKLVLIAFPEIKGTLVEN